MQYSEIMIRYGELSTKHKNRMRFINKLRNNISDVLSIYPQVKVTADRDRAHAYLNGADYTAVAESLKQVFGIQNFSPVYKVEKSVEVLKSAVQEIMKAIYKEGMTFKITSKRSDHNFELDSRELNQTLGGAVFEAIPNVQAQMKNPDINLQVEIREEAAYLSYETFRGAGGLPVGSSGKGMLMLSGGIDSPVAGYLALKKDFDTVFGSYFTHESETAGLGARIVEEEFQEKFVGKKAFSDSTFQKVALVLSKKIEKPEHEVDAITGATLTSNGVSEMFQTSLLPYQKFFSANHK